MANVETEHQQRLFNFLKVNQLIYHQQQISSHPQRIHSDMQNDPKKGDRLGNLYTWHGSDSVGFAIILACCQQQYTTDTSSNLLSLREHLHVL